MRFFLVAFLISLGSCIGVDELDDPIVAEKILVEEEQVALLVNTTKQITPEYYDQYGIKKSINFTWTSSNPTVATIDEKGLIVAKTVGQSVIQPSVGTVRGPLINVNVIPDPGTVAKVVIASSTTALSVGDKVQLQAVVTNLSNNILTGKTVEWFSENNTILTVNNAGLVEATGSGSAAIHAKVEGVKSNSINFNVGGELRTGSFIRAGGYEAKGTASLRVSGTKLILKLHDDFVTSFALGTFIYLSNSTNGSVVRSTGLEVAQITTNGSHTFELSNVAIGTYKYVVILCKPASVTFGYAEMK